MMIEIISDKWQMALLMAFFVGNIWGMLVMWMYFKNEREMYHDEHESESVG